MVGTIATRPSAVTTSGSHSPAVKGLVSSQVIWIAELELIVQDWRAILMPKMSASRGKLVPSIVTVVPAAEKPVIRLARSE